LVSEEKGYTCRTSEGKYYVTSEVKAGEEGERTLKRLED